MIFALSVSDFFSISYEIQFDKTEIRGNEVFHATVTGNAISIVDLPIAVSEVYATSSIIAAHQDTGAVVTLNPSYTVTITPFPSEKGQTAEAIVVVPLTFPEGSESGIYNLSAELIESKAQVLIWLDVTSYLPSSQAIGSVTYESGSSSGGGG
ncbi:MAG: hypothetical protein QGG56_04460, partial [Dehalococcoidia bacterium]|nr:hypothetical protein [Dehalococcoidia bacterium]